MILGLVTVDGVCIGECIYWSLVRATRELQVITAPSLIFTIQKSPVHALSLFQPAVSSSRYLATASNNGDLSASRAQILSLQLPVQNSTPNWQLTLRLAATSHQPPSLLFAGWFSNELNLIATSSQSPLQSSTALSTFLHDWTANPQLTLNSILCCNCQLSRFHLFSIILISPGVHVI
jgi:hypothetical protein